VVSDYLYYFVDTIVDLFLFLGEALSVKLANLLTSSVTSECHVWNLYGPAETTIDCTFHLVDVQVDKTSIPIGRLIPNYACLILDDYLQMVTIGQEGELFVGGVGVFAGYLRRQDLTDKALIKINNHLFYRTGDLVRLDKNGLVYYIGRKDFQVKLHGQRIELAELEKCILDFASHISSCVVIKWNEDHLIAYIESNNVHEDDLRSYCRSRLPLFMIPSMFIILEQFPLNVNGKIDRKRLPTPDFSSLSSMNNEHKYIEARNEIEKQIHLLWCEILHLKQISINTSLFSIGGHSLILIRLYHRYTTIFQLDTKTINIAQLFQNPTIAEHGRLIGQSANIKYESKVPWIRLNLTQSKLFFSLYN
jgi:hypothetical protein